MAKFLDATGLAYFFNGLKAKYISGLSVNGRTITYTKGDGTTGSINTQDTNTVYTAGAGISLSGTVFSNSGVRAVTAGNSNNQISVNTGGDTSTITINNVANATTATTATTATKLGSSTVGSGVRAIYLNAGTATASNSTVGDSTTPVYLKAGTITACDASIGSGWTVSEGSAGWARENSTGFTIQWGNGDAFWAAGNSYATPQNRNNQTITFPRAFTSVYFICASYSIENTGKGLHAVGLPQDITNSNFLLRTITEADGGGDTVHPHWIAFGIS